MMEMMQITETGVSVDPRKRSGLTADQQPS
jgi:hypothetical protein